MPILQKLGALVGINDIHMGLVVVLTLSLGMVTPPYGSCLLITAQIGNIKPVEAFRSCIPIIGLTLLVILIGIIFPDVFLFLPKLFVPTAFPA